MPTIPAEYIGTNTFPDRPPQAEINPESYGRDAVALHAIGGEFADIGGKLLMARKHASDTDAVANASQGTREWYAQRALKLSTENPNGFADQLHAEMMDRLKEDVTTMPSGDAQREYMNQMGEFSARQYGSNLAVQNSNQAKSYEDNVGARIQRSSDMVMNAPTGLAYSTMLSEAQEHERDIDSQVGSVIDPNRAEEIKRKMKESLAKGLFDNYEKNGRDSATIGKHMIDEVYKDPTQKSFLGEAMGADELETRRKRLDIISREGDKTALHDLNARYNNILSSYESFDPEKIARIQPGEVDAVMSGLGRLVGNKTLDQADYNERAYKILAAQGFAGAAKVVENSDYDTIMQNRAVVLDGIKQEIARKGGNPTDAATTDYLNNAYDKYVDSIMRERHKDPAGYADIHAPSLPKAESGGAHYGIPSAAYIEQRVAYLQNIKEPLQGILSKEERSIAVAHFKDMAENNPAQAAKEIQDLNKHQYGAQLISELSNKGSLPGYLKVAANMDDPDAAKEVIQDFSPAMKAKLDDNLKRMDSPTRKAFELSVNTKMAEYNKAVSNMNNASNILVPRFDRQGDFNAAVRQEAIRLEPTFGKDKAIDMAYQNIIGKNFTTVHGALVPNVVGDTPINPDLVSKKMQEIYNPKFWPLFAIQSGDESATLKTMNDQGKWVTGGDGTSAVFMVMDKTGGSDRLHPMLDKRGDPVSFNFKDATLHQSYQEIEDRKGIIEKAHDMWNNLWKEKPTKTVFDAQQTGAPNIQPHFGVTDNPQEPAQQFDPREDPKYVINKYFAIPHEATGTLGPQANADILHPHGEKLLPIIRRAEEKYLQNSGLPNGGLYQLLDIESGVGTAKTMNVPHGGADNILGFGQMRISTAREMGLIVNKLRDDRKNAAIAIPAAAKYLAKMIETVTDGGVPAAVAAYNAGPGTVNKAIKKYGSFAAAVPHLPEETRTYLKKMYGSNKVYD